MGLMYYSLYFLNNINFVKKYIMVIKWSVYYYNYFLRFYVNKNVE